MTYHTVTVDWFHVVQLFTEAVDAVRKAEAKHTTMPKALRWAVLKAADRGLTEKPAAALAELEGMGLFTTTAWRIKEKLRWTPPRRYGPPRRHAVQGRS